MTEEQFWGMVDIREDAECWEWQGYKYTGGYGQVRWESRTRGSHRMAWKLIYGPIPSGLCVCHTCDNPPCCNPSHMFLETYKDNMQDAIIKGRANNEEHRRKIREAQMGNKHLLGHHHSEETRRKISEAKKGRKPMLGKCHSEEAKDKMRDAQKRRRAREKEALARQQASLV